MAEPSLAEFSDTCPAGGVVEEWNEATPWRDRGTYRGGKGAEDREKAAGQRHLQRLEAFSDMQHEVLGRILGEGPLEETLEFIARRIEEVAEGGLLCSIFVMEEGGMQMRLGAAPNLPEEYNEAINPVPVKDGYGSCGTAAARGEMVIVEDTAVHPYWEGLRELVVRHRLRACWSIPVKSSAGVLLGTLAIYHREPRKPEPEEVRWAESAARLTGLAIERMRQARQAQETGAWLGTMLESLEDAFFTLDRKWRFVTLNGPTERLLGRTREALTGKVIWEVFQETAGTQFEAHCRKAMQKQHVAAYVEYQPRPGTWLEVRLHPSSQGLAIYFRDVTAPQVAAAELRASEERFRNVAQATSDAVWDFDMTRKVLWLSDGVRRLFGYTAEEVEPSLAWWSERVHPEDSGAISEELDRCLENGKDSWIGEYRFRRADGSYADVMDRGFIIRDAAGKPLRLAGGISDQTVPQSHERAVREEAGRQARISAIQQEIAAVELNLPAVMDLVAERVRELLGADGGVVELMDQEGLVYAAVAGTAVPHKNLRLRREGSLSGSALTEGRVIYCEDAERDARVNLAVARKIGMRSALVAPLRSGNADVGVLKFYSAKAGAFSGAQAATLGIMAASLGPVILNHRTGSQLKTSEAQYRLLFDHNPQPMWAYDAATLGFLAVNAAAMAQYGYGRKEFLSMRVMDLHADDDLPALVRPPGKAHPLDQPLARWQHRRKNGSLVDVEISQDPLVLDGRDARLVLAHDITERLRSERELARLNRAQRMLTECNEAVFREGNEQDLLERICRIAVACGNYRMAWVGFAAEDAGCTVQPVASSGMDLGFLEKIQLSWSEDHPRGKGPGGKTLRTGRPYVCEDILVEEGIFPVVREEALRCGFRGLLCLPLLDGDHAFGLLNLYSSKPLQVAPEEIRLLQQLADHTAFGLLSLRSRAGHQRLQEAVVKMAASVSGVTGKAFFQHLVVNMADALGAMAAGISRSPCGPADTGRTIAMVLDGELVPDFEYPLEGAPCGILRDQEEIVIPEGVAALFPGLPALAGWGAEAYVGRRLHNAAGEPVGMLYLLFRQPLRKADFITSTLKIFAARAAAEIQREADTARIQQQASLLDKAQDAILVRDFDQKVLFSNQAAERLYGWTAEEAHGHSINELLSASPDRLEEAQRTVLATGEWNGLIEKTTRNGNHLILDSRWTLLTDPDGTPRSILTIDTDVTEREKLAQQCLRAQRMESIGTLAGGIAHDLNNVLAPIMMSIDLLKRTVTDPDSLEVLSTIAGSARRGASMVGQVLSFARGMEGCHVPVQPQRVLEEIEKIARETFPKNIEITSTLAPGLWTVMGDHTQIHQVLLNLCVNARDAITAGGRISLGAENLHVDAQYAAMNPGSRPGPHLVISVEDTGAGMPPQVMEKIFDPFYTTKDLGKGTGLGLSTSLAIIRSHGGFLQVYSEPRKGTCFRVYLPADPTMEGPAPEVEPLLPGGRGELILVIDDEPSIRTITRQTLENYGYRVLLAPDGAEGITLYAQHCQDIAVVITDMMMPVMDGASTIHVLMRMNPEVRIIAASGISSNSATAHAAGSGVRRFLPKPYTASHLLQTLHAVLDPVESHPHGLAPLSSFSI